MRVHVLDMGRTKYGDCILVTRGQRRILIDGAHPGDTARIRSQLKGLLGHNPPFDIDLLVVTHCHSDHIGCLPALIGDGDLTIKQALVADEKLGWGRDAGDNSPTDARGLSAAQRTLVAALQEEDHSDLPSAELAQFLEDAGTLEDKYIEMLEGLGASVVRYGRDSAAKVQQIETAFADFGLKVLGPTQNHLVQCAEAIAQGSDVVVSAVASDTPDSSDLVEVYRRLCRRIASDAEFAADQPGVGAAKNDQSIVIKVAADGWAALLAGDMQFAEPEVPGLDSMMTALRQKVVDAGPYDFIKFTHHTSYNAVDASVLDEWAATKLFAHTGGSNDASHPDGGVLDLLTERQNQFTFARTDRNGIITVEKAGGAVTMAVSKGQTNDFSVNVPEDVPEPIVKRDRERPTTPVAGGRGGSDVIEVVTRIPHTATKVTVTIQVEPGEKKNSLNDRAGGDPSPRPPAGTDQKLEVGGGRALPKLLFVTCRPRLERNIGRMESDRVFEALSRSATVRVVDLPHVITAAEQAADEVRRQLTASHFAGVVVLGGFDVVPAHRLDVLDAAARRRVDTAGRRGNDADDFIVWSDELYGDRDGDYMPELPVSRIPDGRRADVVFAALQAAPLTARPQFGVRNLNRPFADMVFPNPAGSGGELLVSEKTRPEDISAGAAVGSVYYMLHGSARDGTRFWGETVGGAAYEAVSVENVPDLSAGSVIFTGCCWGALSMSPPAAQARPGVPLRPRGPEESIAVAYLKAGAIGFVGCTGSHYSPMIPPYDYFGKPMHDAFWASVAKGVTPAAALFEAKRQFARRMPHGRTDAFSLAVELKILRQYTCLGLGW